MKLSKNLLQSIKVGAWFVGVIWVIHLLQILLGVDFGFLGIHPRHVGGLKGILAAPLIHADFPHLISNSVPLFVLTSTLFFFYKKVATQSFLMIYLLTGLSVWVFAREVFHIGASGVVYGLVSFIFWNGIFRRSLKSVILALIVIILYSGYFAGILPNQPGISWESHLLGGIIGIFVSYYFKDEIEAEEREQVPSWELEEESESRHFLDRDIFEKTKEERLRESRQNPFPDWYSSSTFDEEK